MKILVPIKRVPDPDQRVKIRPDGCGVELANIPFVMNPFDAIAAEEALRIRESSCDPVEAFAVGIGDQDYENELRAALAMGIDRAVRVACETPLDPWNVARILQAVVERESPDFVIMGKQAVDDDANQAGQFLAALLDWPQATFASKIEFESAEGPRPGCRVHIERETDDGIQRIALHLPAVLTTDLRLNEPRYASVAGIMKARKKRIEILDVSDLGVDIEPRVEIVRMESTSEKRAALRVTDVDEFIQQLRASRKGSG